MIKHKMTNLRYLRLSRNLSVKELANEVNLSPSYIYNLESARRQPGISATFALEEYFNKPIDFLLSLYTE